MPSRTLAIGDIHGSDLALETLLARLEISIADTVVVLGDVIDRGPGSKQAIERLLALKQQCRLVLILGNHEEMFLDAIDRGVSMEAWLRYGGTATLFSYDGDARKIPKSHIDFLRSGVDYWETATDIFIHANLEPGVPLERQRSEWLRWTHITGKERPHPSGKHIICGHTPQKTGEPFVLQGWTGIDTYACGTGWLTGLDVASGDYWQADQSRQSRCGNLPNWRVRTQ